MKSGPIIFVEDDIDDKEIMEEVLKELNIPNKLIWFKNADDAWHYLKTTPDQPFIIFSDVNLPKLNGIDFKRRIDYDMELRRKSIPFIFYSTAVTQQIVNEAYTQMTVQGFFQKSNGFEEMKENIKLILDYWMACKHPNTR
jgi:response regulator RpfG family c-di-GMP phosphodiesterase